MSNPEIEVDGDIESRLIIQADMPLNLRDGTGRRQYLTLTPHQSRELVRQLDSILRKHAQTGCVL